MHITLTAVPATKEEAAAGWRWSIHAEPPIMGRAWSSKEDPSHVVTDLAVMARATGHTFSLTEQK